MSPSTDPRSPMFYDWISGYQDFPFDIPQVGKVIRLNVDSETNEVLSQSCPPFHAEGSYSTKFRIQVAGRRVYVDGNASRVNRLDNLYGLTTLADNMAVINSILTAPEIGLPPLTRCTRLDRLQDGSAVVDGFTFTRIDATRNLFVGKGNESAYLRALSSQRFRNSIGYLYPDGGTVVWTPSGGEKAGRLVYPGYYDKGLELTRHLLPKVLRRYGAESEEYRYVSQVRDWCVEVGVVRAEIKLKSELLKRDCLCHWGLFDEQRIWDHLGEFLKVGDKMTLTAHDIASISEELMRVGVCNSMQAATRTATYAMEWMNGKTFDFNKSVVQTHRARLRAIGFDIKLPFDASRHMFFIHNVREVSRTFDVPAPSFYRRPDVPRHLRLVA